MLQIVYTNRMKRDVRRMQRRGKNLKKLEAVLDLLARRVQLPEQYRDHPLSGDLSDFRECHIESDWLLMYQICEDVLILTAVSTGTHADLFNE